MGDPGSGITSGSAVAGRALAAGSENGAAGTIGPRELAAIPTMDLIAELARRECIALRLAIEDAVGRSAEVRMRLRPKDENVESTKAAESA
jgi:hypothetical protein